MSMRITISDGNIYYFVNGDLMSFGPFSKPSADKFYIKSSCSVYLDELRVATGNSPPQLLITPPVLPKRDQILGLIFYR